MKEWAFIGLYAAVGIIYNYTFDFRLIRPSLPHGFVISEKLVCTVQLQFSSNLEKTR